jgi:hypothetical protein
MHREQPPAATATIPSTDQPRPSAWPPEQAVLGHLLDAHPRRLDSVALAGELRDRLERSDVERAIANLSEAGLVERRGEAVEPAPKVIEFEARLS